MKPFTSEQNALIAEGAKLAANLRTRVERAFQVTTLEAEPFRHHYIQSPPGAGKSVTVQEVVDKHALQVLKIHSVTTMSNLVSMLAVAVHNLDPEDMLVVWVDDCNILFNSKDSLDIMKGVLDEERNVLAYNKNLSVQITQLENSLNANDRVRAAALRSFQNVGSAGVEIPTNQLRFIITSNNKLHPQNSHTKNQRLQDEGAIRDRINYVEFDTTAKKSWGWIASVLLNNNILNINEEQKRILLDFMYINWDRLSSTSLRKVKALAAMMINFPEDYPDHWEIELLTSV